MNERQRRRRWGRECGRCEGRGYGPAPRALGFLLLPDSGPEPAVTSERDPDLFSAAVFFAAGFFERFFGGLDTYSQYPR